MKRQQLVAEIFRKKSYLCVGLDTDARKLPAHLRDHPDAIFEFNRMIIDATSEWCVSYKINTAFYEACGKKGWESLEKTIAYIPHTHFTIADAKRGDIGNTSAQYARAFFETIPFDAITVAPYMGEDSIRPFLEYEGKWTILLALTSNPGARDFELTRSDDLFLYERVIKAASRWGTPENLMFVTGATRPEEFENLRKLAPGHFFLVPGIGAQGGDLKGVSEKAMLKDCGLLVNVSRSIIYASENEDFAVEAGEIARKYQYEMQQYFL